MQPSTTQPIPTMNQQDNTQNTLVHPQLNGAQMYPQQPNMIYQQPINDNSLFPQQMYLQQPNMTYQQPMVNPSNPQQAYYLAEQKLAGTGAIVKQVSEALPQKGFELLNQQSAIIIKQKVEMLEVLTGCETQNKYNVYGYNLVTQQQTTQIFKCKEKSNWCGRQCLSGACRPFEMSISTLNANGEYEPFLRLERPCMCTFLCFNRPEVLVTLVENGRAEFLGKVIDPFNCCNMEINTYDQNNTLKHKIYGSCCQLGTFCRCPCDPCQKFDFDVKSASGDILSRLQKKSKGCLQSTFTDADNFCLSFPENAIAADKALLLSAVLFLDFRHFEGNNGGRTN